MEREREREYINTQNIREEKKVINRSGQHKQRGSVDVVCFC